MNTDSFNEDQAELKYLKSKPTCFVIFGKEGCGKKSLAQRFARTWKCVHISISTSILDAIKKKTDNGLQALKHLSSGGEVPEQLCLEILKERVVSPEVSHYGYVLEGFPCFSKTLNVHYQLQFLKNLPLQPDYIINLKISEQDLYQRIVSLKVDPVTQLLYPRTYYDIEDNHIHKSKIDEVGEAGGGPADKEEDDEEFDENESIDSISSAENLVPEDEAKKRKTIESLVFRFEEFPDNVKTSMSNYKKQLPVLEDFIVEQDQQRVITLDANLPFEQMYNNLLTRLRYEPISEAFKPKSLASEDTPDDLEEDEMFHSFIATETVALGFRWRRSKWGLLCPVALADGLTSIGNPKFSIGFLDKVYFLSSEDAMQKFEECPRKYILPPQPLPPCKLCVLGPIRSGKTTLCNRIAQKYGVKVIDMEKVLQEKTKQLQQQIKTENHAAIIEAAIKKVKAAMKRNESEEDEESGDFNIEDIDENHPMVKEEILLGEDEIEKATIVMSPQDCVECLQEQFEEMYQGTDKNLLSGGWILDNFPQTKDQLNMMIDVGISMDEAIVFKEDAEAPVLVQRFKQMQGEVVDEDSLEEFTKRVCKFEQNWQSLQPVMQNNDYVEPLLIQTNLSMDEAFNNAVDKIEGLFRYQAWEYGSADADEEEEDYALLQGDEEEDGENEVKKQPFGDTAHYCPVKLKEEEVLWPGLTEIGVKYREKLYFLSSTEASEKFLKTPQHYLAQDSPIKIPATRLMMVGPKGAGKSTHARILAQKHGLFHINFADRLQEIIVKKTLKFVGEQYQDNDVINEKEDTNGKDDDDSNADEEQQEEEEPQEEEDEQEEEGQQEEEGYDFTDIERNIYNNITENEPLNKETLTSILPQWWNEEPFKSTGFIMEGFPRTSEEVQFLQTNGLYPDGVVFLKVQEQDIVRRLAPPLIEKCLKKRDALNAIKEKNKMAELKQREEVRARKRTEKIELLAAKKREQQELGEESDEEQEDIDEIIEAEIVEEFGLIFNDDDGEEEESEMEAVERINNMLVDSYHNESFNLDYLQESCSEIKLPCIEVDCSQKQRITQYFFSKLLKKQLTNRRGLLDRCQVIKVSVAKKLLRQGYKYLSRYARWCPVKLYDGCTVHPNITNEKNTFPVIYRHYIYFLSSEENRKRFIECPQTYLSAPTSIHPIVPLRIGVLGPPKSGKTTLAERFVREYGLVRLSIGEVVRRVLLSHEKTQLGQQMHNYLFAGHTLPDELALEALETYLLEPQCVVRGFVLDGYPCTMEQLELLKLKNILPYQIVELTLLDKEILRRGVFDRRSGPRTLPLHDSHTILAIRIVSHRKQFGAIRDFYHDNYRNVLSADAQKSKWWLYNTASARAEVVLSNIQTYIHALKNGKASSIKGLCITNKEVRARLGEFQEYCPVSLALNNELVDCSKVEYNLVAEYKHKFYKFADENALQRFLVSPNEFVAPLAPRKLPKHLPKVRSAAYVRKVFPRQMELQGYCPVTYYEGKQRYEAIVPGDPNLVVEHKEKLFSFVDPAALDRFTRFPARYWNQTLPKKLPPKRDPLQIVNLPMLGYLEQTSSTAIIKAMTSVGTLKPKFPYLTAKKSALLYIAYYLKAYNPHSSDYVKAKYKSKLDRFNDHCQLISYLSGRMRRKYLEPSDRPLDFDVKLNAFAALKVA